MLPFADLELDEELHEVRRAGRRIDLSPTEFKLLRYLLRNPRIVLSKAQILDHVWEYDFGGDANVVETYISYLRRKLDAGGPSADPHGARRRLRLRSPPAEVAACRCAPGSRSVTRGAGHRTALIVASVAV